MGWPGLHQPTSGVDLVLRAVNRVLLFGREYEVVTTPHCEQNQHDDVHHDDSVDCSGERWVDQEANERDSGNDSRDPRTQHQPLEQAARTDCHGDSYGATRGGRIRDARSPLGISRTLARIPQLIR